ncbi:four helix bundle protein [Aliarcobacter vitoriensis]|uniref:four helix bundle protein n=1 Tax=Aliarcobacter vitoriensis TaxID=2011099 RepID=UPI003AAAF536
MKCEKLEVWKISARLSADIYKKFVNLKDYGFKDQITRAGLSIPSNIAEGMEKESIKEQIRFLDIAKGSAAEFMTQTYIAMDIEYLDKISGKIFIEKTNQILAMLTKLQQKLKEKI